MVVSVRKYGVFENSQIYLAFCLVFCTSGFAEGTFVRELNADQMTLICWDTLHQEVMDGGFIQLIHNGYGPFIFKNPFAKALNKMWHLRDLSKMLYEVHTLWLENRKALEADCTDEEFMALFEQYPQFDDYDDMFIENEERWTKEIALYVDENVEKFAEIQ